MTFPGRPAAPSRTRSFAGASSDRRPVLRFASALHGPALSLACLALLSAFAGCSTATFSASSDSSSASSASLSPQRRESAYRDDVRDLTAVHVRAGGVFEALQRLLGDLARRHGISDWEDAPATYEGIGLGLGKAKVKAAELDAYAVRLGGLDAEKVALLRHGYEVAVR